MTRRTQYIQGVPSINPPTIFRSGFESGLLESPTDFQFDRANRLTGSHNGQIAYLYDAHGRRVRSSQQFFGTRFEVYSQNGQLLYLEDGPTNTRHDYIQFNGQLVAERQQPLNGGSATTSYLHSDLLGSLSVKTANQGSVVYRSRYQAFGAPLDGWRDGPGYTKHVMDSASELVYMQQRYYDPATLRFISTDPVSADPLNFNRYWYANNNPYTYVDPDGRRCWTINADMAGAANLGNSGSVYCSRGDTYTRFDNEVSGSTRFFAAAAMTVEFLANTDWGSAAAIGGLTDEANYFLRSVSRELYSLNQATYRQILSGALVAEGLDGRLIAMEQSAVQSRIDALPSEERARIIGSINASFRGRASATFLSRSDARYVSVLDRVANNLGRDIDFGTQSDREAIGHELIRDIRNSGGCDVTGTRIKAC